MEPLAPLEPPDVRLGRRNEGVDLHVTMSLAPVPGAAGDRPLELGLAAVVEDRDVALAWWALRHPAARIFPRPL